MITGLKPSNLSIMLTDFYIRDVLSDAVMLLSEMSVEQHYVSKREVPLLTKAIVIGPIGRGSIQADGSDGEAAVLACHLVSDDGTLADCGHLFVQVPDGMSAPVHEEFELDVSSIVDTLRKSAENGYDMLPAE